MAYTVLIQSYKNTLPVDRREILRYAGMRDEDDTVNALLDECLSEALPHLCYRACYSELTVGQAIEEGVLYADSVTVSQNLDACERMILFAATLGIEIDRLIARYMAVSPTRALLLQAIGAERIEALCDMLCKEISERARADGYLTTRRFSPGYGDLSIESQREIFRILDCPRKIGLTCHDSLMMSPTKSVTAIVGLKNKDADR